jgi:hypothetical protein
MLHRISVSLLMLFCVSTAANSTQEDRQKAVTLWDQAIAAKGGRDRLAGIRMPFLPIGEAAVHYFSDASAAVCVFSGNEVGAA